MRRRMLEAVKLFQQGERLIGHDPSIDWGKVKSEQLIMPVDKQWQELGKSATPA